MHSVGAGSALVPRRQGDPRAAPVLCGDWIASALMTSARFMLDSTYAKSALAAGCVFRKEQRAMNEPLASRNMGHPAIELALTAVFDQCLPNR